jgi:hypothetical protein
MPIEDRPAATRARIEQIALTALVTFCLISAAAGRLSYLIKPFDHDARMFVYLGKLVCDGGRYGHDLIDNKFPSVGLMTSVCWRMFGTNWFGYVLLQTVLAAGGALLLGRAAARAFGEQARWPASLFAVVYLNLNVAVFGGFQLETLQTFFAILAAGAAMEALRGGSMRDALALGLAGGCAMMLKPTGGAVLGAFALAACFTWRREWGRIALHGIAAAIGLAIPMLVVLAYLVETQTLADLPALYRQIARYAAETPMRWDDWLKPIVVCAVAGFPIAVRGWVARRDKVIDINFVATRSSLATFAIAWFTLELLGAVMQRRMYSYHFLPVAAPAALIFAMFPRRMRVMPLAAALLPAAVLSLAGANEVWKACYPPTYRLAASDYLAAHTQPGDSVWQDSMPRLLLETGLKPGARIPLTFLFFNYDAAPIEYCDVMIRDFEERKPKYIVLPENLEAKLKYESERAPEMQRRPVRAENYRNAWRRIETYVKENYAPEATIDREIIYRRRS